jgi:O-antigen/teichoic acid export membrane protein
MAFDLMKRVNLPRLGGLARSTIGVMAWHGIRLVVQLAWVVLLARSLGAEGYGVFSGAAGLALSMSGIAGLGLSLRMYQDVAREPARYPLRLRQAWRGLWWSAAGLALAFVAVSLWLFDELGWQILLAIALSELVFAPVATQVAFAFAAHGRMAVSAAVPALLATARVLAVLVFAVIDACERIAVYAGLHAIATALAVVLLVALQKRQLPAADTHGALGWDDIRAGLGFSAVWASGMALGSADKAVALKAGGAELAGHYTAAYRLASLVALPVDALVMAVMPRLFRVGAGMQEHPRILSVLASVTLVYGLFAGGFVWLAADALPWLLGEGFLAAAETARMLSIYVPIYCMRTLGCNVLLGLEQKRWRFGSELSALALIIVIGFARIPVAGLAGAVEALIIGELSLMVLAWLRVMACRPRARNRKA